MRFAHLSDLHLGKRVCEFSMLDDQRYILEEILPLLDQTPVDGVLLAGDLFDSARVYRDTRSGQWAIEDLNSTNGTVVNQQRINRPTILPARIPVRIGATTFELR